MLLPELREDPELREPTLDPLLRELLLREPELYEPLLRELLLREPLLYPEFPLLREPLLTAGRLLPDPREPLVRPL